jgi:hypothetical protein
MGDGKRAGASIDAWLGGTWPPVPAESAGPADTESAGEAPAATKVAPILVR